MKRCAHLICIFRGDRLEQCAEDAKMILPRKHLRADISAEIFLWPGGGLGNWCMSDPAAAWCRRPGEMVYIIQSQQTNKPVVKCTLVRGLLGPGQWGGLGLWCKYWWKEVCEHVYKDIVYPYEIVKQEAYRPVQLRCNLARIRKTHAKLQTKLRNFGCTSTSIYMLMCRALFAKYLLGTLAHLQNIFTSQGRVMPNYKVKKFWQYF